MFTPALLDVALGGPLTRLVGGLIPDFIVIGNRIVLFGLTLIATLASTWLATRFLDRRALRELASRWMPPGGSTWSSACFFWKRC